MTLDELNGYVKLFGDSQKAFMRSENRALLRSVLFDVPRRSSIGWYCYYEKAADLLRELTDKISPEDIGMRMRKLCSRPYNLQLSIIMCSYFGARQQILLDNGLTPGQSFSQEKVDDAYFIIDFWPRVSQSYRSDGLIFPDQADGSQAILPEETNKQLISGLDIKGAGNHQRLRRLAATLELYEFILHGEQRDGLFTHGPYDIDGYSRIVVFEFTDLQNSFLPWADTEARIPYSNLALVRRIREIKPRFDLFGGVLWDSPDIAPFIEAEGLFTRKPDDTIVKVAMEEAEQIESAAASAQIELYLRAAEWSPRYKAEYGVHLFANHLRTFFQLVSPDGEWDERIRSEFESAAKDILDPMLAQDEPPAIWKFMAETNGDYFWPIIEPAA